MVSGLVQGVYFRANAQKQALALNLTGYAKNLPDGRVEIVAKGPAEQLENLIAWCHHGPRAARVSQVLWQWQAADFKGNGFEVC